MNKAPLTRPWNVSFSYGRALQHSVLRAWVGKAENIPAAQAKLLERAKANGQASLGIVISLFSFFLSFTISFFLSFFFLKDIFFFSFVGKYEGGSSGSAAGESLFVSNYSY